MKKFFIFFIFALLAVSIVSASWLSDLFGGGITGNVVNDNTALPDSTNPKCEDTDLGVKATEAGVVFTRYNSYPDKCSGKKVSFTTSAGVVSGYSQIVEVYCQNGKKTQTMNSSQLGRGYCKSESVDVEGKIIPSAKWVSAASACIAVANGVKDETGTIYRNVCSGTTLRKYSCNGTAVESLDKNCSTSDGFGKCTPAGCIGACTETDAENNKDVPGTVTIKAEQKKDECNAAKTGVKQYKCANGYLRTVPYKEDNAYTPCGANRECVLSESGEGYCKDKYAGATTIETLTERVKALENLAVMLSNRISELENPTTEESAAVSENYDETGCTAANTWCDGTDVNHDGSVDVGDLGMTA